MTEERQKTETELFVYVSSLGSPQEPEFLYVLFFKQTLFEYRTMHKIKPQCFFTLLYTTINDLRKCRPTLYFFLATKQ